MGNLKGSTFEKQIKNAMSRLSSIGQKRHNTDSNKTHSVALSAKREMYLKDFKNYLENKEISTGKLNTHMSSETVKSFLEERTINLSAKSSLDYSAGFNSMVRGLEETRVNIDSSVHNTINEMTTHFRENFNEVKDDYTTGRAITDTSSFINNLQEIRESSAIVAELQLETGYRVSEALEVANNFNNYYNPIDNSLTGVSGKGGQEYISKEISSDLAYKLQNLNNVPAYSTYQEDLKQLDHTSHDLRITYAQETYSELKAKFGHDEALKKTSEELNHHRSEITQYYLNRA